jgi:hypothetical protein
LRELIERLKKIGYDNTLENLYNEYLIKAKPTEENMDEEFLRGTIFGYLLCLCDKKIISEQECEDLHIELICNLPPHKTFYINKR